MPALWLQVDEPDRPDALRSVQEPLLEPAADAGAEGWQAMNNTRFKSGDVTETLVKATEFASELNATDALVILYSRPADSAGYHLRYVCSDNITIETANWLLDKMKDRLIREEV